MAAVMEEKTFRGLRDVALLAVIAGAIFFLISLITFTNNDAGWNHIGSIQQVSNACGTFGAWLADFVLSFFGLCAYSFPFIIVWQSYLTYSPEYNHQEKITSLLHWLGIFSIIVSTSALFNLHLLRTSIELPSNTGGILGQEVAASLSAFGTLGSTLFLLVILFAGIHLATEVSLLAILDAIGKFSLKTGDFCYRQIHYLFEKYQEASELRSTPDVIEEVEDIITSKKNDKNTKKNKQENAVFYLEAPAKEIDKKKSEDNSLIDKSEKLNKEKSEKSITKTLDKIVEKVQSVVETTKENKSETKKDKIIPDKKIEKTKSSLIFPNSGKLPNVNLLDNRENHITRYSETDLEDMSRLLEEILEDFNVLVEVVGYQLGPVITRFELQPAAGVKVSRISSLSKDLARALSVTSVRIVEIIPGKSFVGLEIPNREREMVNLRELLESTHFEKSKSPLTLAMGKDISGFPLVADLAKMPHALVAGTTGSGKSVAINTMILSLLYKATPEQVRLIMIDPKMLELSVYEGIPHLLTPVVTDMKEASNALRWAVAEMERRYKLMSKMGVRNLAGFNQLIEEAAARGETIKDPTYQTLNPLAENEQLPDLTLLPSIVIVIDELADMMMIVGKKVEELIARLAQKARAAGIHLILATQRPSVDVLTGLIKANVPTRISFQVSSRIDSRTILDQGGAETLLGNGDMLFLPSGTSIPTRAHGAFVDDNEVHRIVEFLKTTAPTNYLQEITQELFDNTDNFWVSNSNSANTSGENDPLYDEAVKFVVDSRKASISSVQRRFRIGYNRAATIIENMELAGIVSTPETNGTRVVLASPVAE